MKKLLEHIEKLLLVHDCVIIPRFGGFVANYEQVHFSQNKKTFAPPARRIGFNIHLQHNDGMLAQAVMKAENCTYERAAKRINRQIELIINILKTEHQLLFGNIGRFLMNENGAIIFEPDNSFVATPQYYGLEIIDIQPINNKIPVYKSVWQYAAVALLALLLLPTNLLDKRQAEQASVIAFKWNTEPTFHQDTLMVDSKVVAVTDTLPLLQTEETAPLPEHFYHIIIASLPSEELANQYLQEIAKYPFQNIHIVHSENRYRIAVESFSENDDAEIFRTNFVEKYPAFGAAWIFEEKI